MLSVCQGTTGDSTLSRSCCSVMCIRTLCCGGVPMLWLCAPAAPARGCVVVCMHRRACVSTRAELARGACVTLVLCCAAGVSRLREPGTVRLGPRGHLEAFSNHTPLVECEPGCLCPLKSCDPPFPPLPRYATRLKLHISECATAAPQD